MSRLPVDQQQSRLRGQDYIWSVILELHQQGPFSLRQISEQTNASHATVSDYVTRLKKAGYLEVVDRQPTGFGKSLYFLYRVARPTREAPRLRKDGSLCPPTKREGMWRTMRMINKFSYKDLVVTASPEAPIKEQDAKDYCKHLSKAGYLVCLEEGKPGKPAVYRLARNTGPKPPMIQRVKHVYDPNLNEVVWQSEAAHG